MKKQLLFRIMTMMLLCISTSDQAMQPAYNSILTGLLSSKLKPAALLLRGNRRLEITPQQLNSYDTQQAISLLQAEFGYGFDFENHKTMQEYAWIHGSMINKGTKQLVGTALFRYENPEEIRLAYLAVVPYFRNKGVGSSLIDYIAQATQCSTISIQSFGAAVNFHKRLGFVGEGFQFYKTYKQ